MAMKKLLLTGIAALFLVTGTAHAADFCVQVVEKPPGGFLALRAGPGTQFKILAKLKPGFPLDALADYETKWTRVQIVVGKEAYVYTKYVKLRDCVVEPSPSSLLHACQAGSKIACKEGAKRGLWD
jgi:hypothetical protein